MAKNYSNSKFGLRQILLVVLAIIMGISLCLFFTGCGSNDTSDSTDQTYSSNDTASILNGSFNFGNYALSLNKYPQVSAKDWSLSVDGSAPSSSVSSGIVDTNNVEGYKAWDELLKTLYKDSDFINYVQKKLGIADLKNEARKQGHTTSEAIMNYVLENYITANNFIQNPGTHVGATDSKVYMLNNYRTSSYTGFGTAQKITSSSTLNITKGKVAKISVWLCTDSKISEIYENTKSGANIRIGNSFNSVSQGDFVVYGINTDSPSTTALDWKNYTIYVIGDENYDCSVELSLGLGIGNGSNYSIDNTEGTAYFDDIVYSELSMEEYNNLVNDSLSGITPYTMEYVNTGATSQYVSAGTENTFIYDMRLNSSISQIFKDKDLNENGTPDYNEYLTTKGFDTIFSNKSDIVDNKNFKASTSGVTSATKLNVGGVINSSISNSFVTNSTTNLKDLVMTLTKASVILQTTPFTVDSNSYLNVSFDYTQDLSRFNDTGLNVYLYDNEDKILSDTAIITNNENKTTSTKIFIENKTDTSKQFYLVLIIGPSDINNVDYDWKFPTGKVTLSNLTLANGSVDADDNYYNVYSLNKKIASYTYAFSDTESTADTYYLSNNGSDMGNIVKSLTKVNGYNGVASDSVYVKYYGEENFDAIPTDAFKKDSRVNGEYINGNFVGYAGLFNTKYVNSYTSTNAEMANYGATISSKLSYNEENNIQPLVIYNANNDHYGFIGKQTTISTNSYAKISVKVRVLDNAVAYIYLVDTTSSEKRVMDISFAVNTDGSVYTDKGNTITKTLLFEGITASQMDETGWATFTFYIATGNTEKSFRLELWNGGRDGSTETASKGHVFFALDSFNDNETFSPITLSGAFSEPTRWTDTFYNSSSIFYGLESEVGENAYLYKRELDDTEKQYNVEQSINGTPIVYPAKYIWMNTQNIKYAIYNSIDPIPADPYGEEETPSETPATGCNSQTNTANYWLSFSSLLLAVVLVVAIIMLFVKNIRRRMKANKSDAKSHYTVTSRYRASKSANKEKPSKTKTIESDLEDYNASINDVEETTKPTTSEELTQEVEDEKLNEYVYGDVQDFGDAETNEFNDNDKN